MFSPAYSEAMDFATASGRGSGKKLGGIDFSKFTYIGRGTADIKFGLHKIHICCDMSKELTVASTQAV